MTWDALFRSVRLLLLAGGGALVACRYGWAAVALCALAVALHSVEVFASRAKHEAEVRALRADVDEAKDGLRKLTLLMDGLNRAARKPGF